MRHPFPKLLLLATLLTLPAHASDPTPQPDEKQKQAYTTRLDALAPQLAQLHGWLDIAESNPDAKIILPAGRLGGASTAIPAALLVFKAALQLHHSLGSPPAHSVLADFPLAVEVEACYARAAWVNGQYPSALKTLQAATPKEGANEASVWLATFQLRQWLAQATKGKTPVAGLPDWLGLPLDWAALKPVLPEVAGGELSPAVALADHADTLIQSLQGEAQVRAALSVGDAFGLLGQWDEARQAYGFVIQQSNYLNSRSAEYQIGEDNTQKRGVSGALAVKAKAQSARIDRILLMGRLSVEFVLYREGHGQMLRGDHKGAIATFDRLLDITQKQGEDAAKKAGQEAGKKDAKVVDPDMESPFEAAAKLYRERSRLALGDSARALAGLRSVCAEDANGLYRGEALLVMAQAAMDAERFALAVSYYGQLDDWIKHARETQKKEQWDFATLLPGIAASAAPLTQPAAEMWTAPDFWGHRHRQPIHAGQLVNAKTAPWYLDWLEEQMVKDAGFCAFAKRDFKQATAFWKRLAVLLPEAQAGQTLAGNANECTRLLWAAEHHRMLALPEEAGLFDAIPTLKKRILYAEFLYGTQAFSRAAEKLRQIIALDDKVKATGNRGGLSDPQRDYLWVTLGTVLHRLGDRNGALACFDKVLERGGGTQIERRAALAYVTLAIRSKNKGHQQRAEALENALIKAGGRDHFSCLLRLNKATRLAYADKSDEAQKLLAWFTEKDGSFYTRAQWQLQHGGKLE